MQLPRQWPPCGGQIDSFAVGSGSTHAELGALVVLTGVVVGATTGAAVESGLRQIRYPDLISIPMNCPVAGVAVSAPAAKLAGTTSN